MRKWIFTVGYFIILNLLFIIFDSTPFIKDLDFGNFGESVLQMDLFTKWFNFYDTPFFNVVLFFAILHLIITGIYDVLFKTTTN